MYTYIYIYIYIILYPYLMMVTWPAITDPQLRPGGVLQVFLCSGGLREGTKPPPGGAAGAAGAAQTCCLEPGVRGPHIGWKNYSTYCRCPQIYVRGMN